MARLKSYIQQAIRLKADPPVSHLHLRDILGSKGYVMPDWLEYQVLSSEEGCQIVDFLNEKTKEAVLISAEVYDHPDYTVKTYSEKEVHELAAMLIDEAQSTRVKTKLDNRTKRAANSLVFVENGTPYRGDEQQSTRSITDSDLRERTVDTSQLSAPTLQLTKPNLDTAEFSVGPRIDDHSRILSAAEGYSHTEINDLIGSAPNWLLRSGIMMIALVVAVIIAMSAVISYPDKILATGIVTTKEPPLQLIAERSGRISELYVSDKDDVIQGQEILYLHNTAEKDDVTLLMGWITDFEDGRDRQLPDRLRVGELQSLYAQLQLTLNEYKQELSLTTSKNQVHTINSELQNVSALQLSIEKERQQYLQELELARIEEERAQKLLSIGGISEQDAERAKSRYAQIKRSYESLEKSTIQSDISRDQLQLEQQRVREQRLTTLQEYRYRLAEITANLRQAYEKWYHEHHLIADINGKVDLQSNLSVYASISPGQMLGYILPDLSHNQKYVKAAVATDGIAKLDSNSSIIIKLDAYPYKEYGVIEARAHSMSLLPYTDQERGAFYEVSIPLSDTLITNYKKPIVYRPDMDAYIEMITEDKSILQRIFEDLLSLVSHK